MPRDINTVVVHCAATKPSMDIGATQIRKWHVEERNWRDIGYHFVIRRSGVIESGRPITESGAHARGHNKNSIGICLVGGISEEGKPDFNFTFTQLEALKDLVDDLEDEYGPLQIIGHRDISKKKCPNFDVSEFFGGI